LSICISSRHDRNILFVVGDRQRIQILQQVLRIANGFLTDEIRAGSSYCFRNDMPFIFAQTLIFFMNYLYLYKK
jgi:hypothetical protein